MSNLEIERKFLVLQDYMPFAKHIAAAFANDSKEITQFYLDGGNTNREQRLRREHRLSHVNGEMFPDKYYYSVKTPKGNSGLVRRKYKTMITRNRFIQILQKQESTGEHVGIIKKLRTRIPIGLNMLGGNECETQYADLDLYKDKRFKGLATIGIKFPDEATANGYAAPFWIGLDVTGRPEYTTTSLAANGLPENHEENIAERQIN